MHYLTLNRRRIRYPCKLAALTRTPAATRLTRSRQAQAFLGTVTRTDAHACRLAVKRGHDK